MVYFSLFVESCCQRNIESAILNKRNQCYLRSNHLLLYIKRKKKGRKSKIIKAIHLGYSFLKRQKKLLIAALIGAAGANIGDATIYGALSIDN